MKYELSVKRKVSADEIMKIILDADDDDEAKDFAFELASTFPHAEFVADRCVVKHRTIDAIDVKDIEIIDVKDMTIGPRTA